MNDFDKNIKEQLDQMEFPFDEKAWTQMSARLDKAIPTNSSNKLLRKIFLSSLSLVLLTSGYLFFSGKKGMTKAPTISLAKEIAPSAKEPEVKVSEDELEIKNVTKENNIPKTEYNSKVHSQKVEKSNKQIVFNNSSNILLNEYISQSKQNSINESLSLKNSNLSSVPTPIIELQNSTNVNTKLDLKSTYCLGEKIAIKNDQNQDLLISGPNTNIIVKANSSQEITAKYAGDYNLNYNSNKVGSFSIASNEKKGKIEVKDNYFFEKGIPYSTVDISDNQNIISWSVNGNTKSIDNKSFTVFKKGSYDVVFNVLNNLGCESKLSTTVYITENYNLLAPTAFNLNSIDVRNQTFIPYALTQRDVNFELIIIEPASGKVIFRTHSTQGWNGIDTTTGEAVAIQKPYVWKVTLQNSLPGEQKEYSGVVTRID